MDKGSRDTGTAFRQALIYTKDQVDKERILMFKQRGIMRKILDTNTRLMGMGFNKLLESWKSTQSTVKSKMKFILQSLTDKNKFFTLQAYNGLKSRKLALAGVGSDTKLSQRNRFCHIILGKTMARLYEACSKLATHKNFLTAEANNTKDKTSQKQALSNLMNSNKALYDKKIDLIRTDADKLSAQLTKTQTQKNSLILRAAILLFYRSQNRLIA